MTAPTRRDYDAQPVSVQLGLEAVIVGLSGDLTDLRTGKISPNDALARAAVAKQLFNGVRLYLQAMKTLEAHARTAVGGPSVGTGGEAEREPKNTPANGDSQ